MRLTFLGTRANTPSRSRQHRLHSALLLEDGARVMVDCGADWSARVAAVRPDAIVVTHGHPDHAGGLRLGAPCPVYATADAWAALDTVCPAQRREITPHQAFDLGHLTFTAWPVVHSLRAPAVGYRISDGSTAIFYVPDVVSIPDAEAALAGVRLYVGDGATLTQPLVRRRGDQLFGHTTVRAQIGWCARAGVPLAIFTHCGQQIVEGDGRTMGAEVRALGRAKGVVTRIAHDGLVLEL